MNTDKCRSEDLSDDLDFNGLSDDEQPLYTARNGDASKGENPDRIYLLRSFHAAETHLGISDYTPTGTSAGNADQPIQERNLLASSKPIHPRIQQTHHPPRKQHPIPYHPHQKTKRTMYCE